MDDFSQIEIPASFAELFASPGRVGPRPSRGWVAQRHEFCEDLATLLTEQADTIRWELGVTEADVLERVHRGLLAEGSGVDPIEAWWVLNRLAELLGWPAPDLPDPRTPHSNKL